MTQAALQSMHDGHHAHPGDISAATPMSLTLYSPAGAVQKASMVTRAARRLANLGFVVEIDSGAKARFQRFAGDDAARLAAIHRVASAAPDIAMATRGGYGLMRLLDGIDWPLLARSVERGTRWVGYSDLTSLQMGLLALHKQPSWMGPMATGDFGGDTPDDITEPCFVEAMTGELEAVGFRTDPGFDGLEAKGTMWGGNLCSLVSLLGTRYFPRVNRGILVLEDVGEHPYRVERMLLQLAQAGVLDRQRAVLMGAFSDWRKVPQDRGFGLKSVLAHLRSVTPTPILTGFPFGHVPTKVTVPIGRPVQLVVDGRQAFVAW